MSEDRKRYGLVLEASIAEEHDLATLPRFRDAACSTPFPRGK